MAPLVRTYGTRIKGAGYTPGLNVGVPCLGAGTRGVRFALLPYLPIARRNVRPLLAWQVANMAIRRKNLEAITEVTVNGFGFCWRFDNDDFHHLPLLYCERPPIKAKIAFVKISDVR
mgnify:CR=1 FL=1